MSPKFSQHQLIICTKDRPDSLRQALASCENQPNCPRTIMVVDSSKDDKSFDVVKAFRASSGLEIVYFRTEPGLTKQRNIGVSKIKGEPEVIHFLDDDSVVQPGYFDAIMETFQRHPGVLAVGGRILNLPEHKVSRIKVFFNLDSFTEGKVLKSGINILNFTGSSDRKVDWISGCSMSFHTSVFRNLDFDERRHGNSLGEDVDFCLRVKELGSIVWTPSATLMHIQSPINRDSAFRVRVGAFMHYLQLAQDGLGGVRKSYVYASQIVSSLINVVISIVNLKPSNIKEEIQFWKAIIHD